jgi:hypothetical protein
MMGKFLMSKVEVTAMETRKDWIPFGEIAVGTLS